ncbi:MAG: hypothetical protein BroJett039_09980 [Chloroflexota bacterium]|nr:MAG: hypothetical protein BroJett039_09980 [Chloroflexota bacterium]
MGELVSGVIERRVGDFDAAGLGESTGLLNDLDGSFVQAIATRNIMANAANPKTLVCWYILYFSSRTNQTVQL